MITHQAEGIGQKQRTFFLKTLLSASETESARPITGRMFVERPRVLMNSMSISERLQQVKGRMLGEDLLRKRARGHYL